MREIARRLRKFIFYLISGALITYLILSIGPVNIYNKLISIDLWMGGAGVVVTFIAAIIRIYKFSLLLTNKDKRTVLEIFVSSRLGKEVSFAGYFIPLIKKSNRKDGTLNNLIVDRYTEIFSTLVIAALSCLIILGNSYFEHVIFLTISGSAIVMLILPFLRISFFLKLSGGRYFLQLLNKLMELQSRLKFNVQIFRIYGLSIVSTICDFIAAYFVFRAYNISVDLFSISVVWAASGLAAILAFMIIGSTEVSVIYLYKFLNGIDEVVTASFLIVSRLINIFVLLVLFLYLIVWDSRRVKTREQVMGIEEENIPLSSVINSNKDRSSP